MNEYEYARTVSVKHWATTIDETITLLHLIYVHTTWHIGLNNGKIVETIRRGLHAHLIRGRNRQRLLSRPSGRIILAPARSVDSAPILRADRPTRITDWRPQYSRVSNLKAEK